MAGTYDGSLFMRPLALGWTAYLFSANLLFILTRGTFKSPDSWAEIYTLVLAAYAGGPEVKQWLRRALPADTDSWLEKVRKGGPLVIAWNVLLAGAGALRIYDPSWPMPPELKAVTMQVTALFFGTYALRQARKRSVSQEDAAAFESSRVLDILKQRGPATPAAIAENLGASRRTVARILSQLAEENKVVREARYPTDPKAAYRLA